MLFYAIYSFNLNIGSSTAVLAEKQKLFTNIKDFNSKQIQPHVKP